MDLIASAIIAALASGVVSGAAEVGKGVIVDAYSALKNALKNQFGADGDLADAVEKLEKRPDSAGRQTTLEEEIASTGASDNSELQKLAQNLLEALKSTPQGAKAISKYRIDARDAEIGIVGDGTQVEGGIHFGNTKE